MSDRYTLDDLRRLQSMSLGEKIDHSIFMIKQFYEVEHGNVYISLSGGKDSTVLRHLVEVMAPQRRDILLTGIPLVYADTGLEYPEIREFAVSFPNAVKVKPKMNFLEVLQKYGYPIISKAVSNGIENARKNPNGSRASRVRGEYKKPDGSKSIYDLSKWAPLMELPIKISDQCCTFMKKEPLHRYERKSGRFAITGTTAAESLQRTQWWIGRGCNFFADDGKKSKSNPLSPWLEQDVLHYIKKYNVKICSVYGDVVYQDEDGNDLDFALDEEKPLHCTGCDRTGCIYCPFGMHLEKGETRYQRLKRTHPRQYEFSLGGGEWGTEGGKQIWMPNKKGLGFAKVFDLVNEIYGKDFFRYE